jgi:tRNA (guanine-N(7)-)-methyltransferase
MNSAMPMARSRYATRMAEFPDIVLPWVTAFTQRGRWEELFRNRIGPAFTGRIILEIGCSDAQYLVRIAARHPDTAFVGIDWKCKAIYDGARRIQASDAGNVVLLHARGHELMKLFSPAELDEIWIFHPDPCDKEAELKNRLISNTFLLQTDAVLKDRSSLVALKTDHRDYYQSVLHLFRSASAEQQAAACPQAADRFQVAMSSTDYWHDPIAISHAENLFFAKTTTPFEARYIRKHLPIYYIELRKKQAAAESRDFG